METPSSTRRLTRSQTTAALSRKIEESSADKGSSVRRTNDNKNEQDRCALIDITNDSPIVGVAAGVETPLSGMTTKRRSNRIKMINKTPCSGSGEALLRGQVKALLHKVEEEGGGGIPKISFPNHGPFLHLQGFLDSPTGLIAPTPANTPQIPNLNLTADDQINNANGCNFTPLPVIEEQLKICQVVGEVFEGSNSESEKSVTRSLLLDFSEKSDSLSSVVTTDDDSASNWSIQVNASTNDDDEDDYIEEDDEEEEDYLDKICRGLGKISINCAAKFEGKRTKFDYNSDDEIIVVEELNGLATPKGKHLRFLTEEEEEEDY